jgi:hypothetical protein
MNELSMLLFASSSRTRALSGRGRSRAPVSTRVPQGRKEGCMLKHKHPSYHQRFPSATNHGFVGHGALPREKSSVAAPQPDAYGSAAPALELATTNTYHFIMFDKSHVHARVIAADSGACRLVVQLDPEFEPKHPCYLHWCAPTREGHTIP